jgi:prepilin-type N-terminal cleavage/methylation domain-containing protein
MKKEQGFTLIELLVVIAIIAILSSVVLASLATARAKARDARRLSDISQIELALRMYEDANQQLPPVAAGMAYCLGELDGATCWPTVTAPSIFGSTTLKTMLSPYLPVIPKDPTPTRPLGDRYLLANGLFDFGCDGPTTPNATGTYIIWEPDKVLSGNGDALCLGAGRTGCCSIGVNCSGGYFCAYQVGN